MDGVEDGVILGTVDGSSDGISLETTDVLVLYITEGVTYGQ